MLYNKKVVNNLDMEEISTTEELAEAIVAVTGSGTKVSERLKFRRSYIGT